jgi:hypothetical protein
MTTIILKFPVQGYEAMVRGCQAATRFAAREFEHGSHDKTVLFKTYICLEEL